MSETFLLIVHFSAVLLAIVAAADCAMKRNMPAFYGWFLAALWPLFGALRYV